jgi:hypothetical protein
VLALPQTAVVSSLYGDYVYALRPREDDEGFVARQVFVEPGRRAGGLVEVRSGLEPGERVVATGQNRLSGGQPVTTPAEAGDDAGLAGTAPRQEAPPAMSASDVFIRRPVLSTVLGLLILLVGLQGLVGLQTRQYPDVDETVITVTTTYPGAAPDLIQGFITAPIAASVATTENVDYVSTQSRPSASVVSVHMRLGSDPDAALTEVMSKVNEVRGSLPSDAEDPVIVKGTGMSSRRCISRAEPGDERRADHRIHRAGDPPAHVDDPRRRGDRGHRRRDLRDARLDRPGAPRRLRAHGPGCLGRDRAVELPRGTGADAGRARQLSDPARIDAGDAGDLRRPADRRDRRRGVRLSDVAEVALAAASTDTSSPSTASPAPSSASIRRPAPTRSTWRRR